MGLAVATRVLVRERAVAVRAGLVGRIVAVRVRVLVWVRVSEGVGVSVAGPGVAVGPVGVGVAVSLGVAVPLGVRVAVRVAVVRTPPLPTTIVTSFMKQALLYDGVVRVQFPKLG